MRRKAKGTERSSAQSQFVTSTQNLRTAAGMRKGLDKNCARPLPIAGVAT